MLLGVNLGFWCSVVVVVVGWLAGRWKWRRVAARREEVRRLMAFASEETARVELEAAAYGYGGYGAALAAEPVVEEPVVRPGSSPGRQLQYQCEVCFSPTTTRCKQCKSVHYCSRKCQVFHWRQGHKDECRSVTTHHSIDVEVHSRLKEFKQEEFQGGQNEVHVMHNKKQVESPSDKSSNPNLHVLGENNDPETATKDKRKQAGMNVESSAHLPDKSSSPTILIGMPVAADKNLKNGNKYDEPTVVMGVESSRQISSEKSSLPDPEYTPAATTVSNQLKYGCLDTDKKSESSSSSGCSATDSEDHSEPSKPSDFWAGTIEPKKANKNALEFGDDKMLNSRFSFLPSSGRTNVHVEILGSDMNRAKIYDPHPDISMMPRKSIALSEVSEDGLKSMEPLALNRKLPGKNGISCSSTVCSPQEEAKLPSNHKGLSEEGHLPSKHVDDVSSLHSQAPKVAEHEVDGTNGLLDTLKSQRNDSSRRKSSEAHSSSSVSTRKTTIPDAQSLENERTRTDASCSVDSSGYMRVAKSRTNPSTRRVVDELSASNSNRHGSVGAGSGIMGRYEGSFPYELFVKLYNWNKVELRPSGLKNCGNSCYANAVLQCLAFTPPLTAYFLQGLHAKNCHKKEWCFTCEFEMLVNKAKEDNYPLSPARLMSQMQHVASHLGNGREEDAHEFLRYAIDAMQLGCLKDGGVKLPSSLDEETTLLGLTFGGYLQSKIECMRCGGKSKQHERMMDLTIEIGGEIGTLEDALRQFTRSEILDGENKYRCGRCKSYEKAKKKLRVLEAPNVLTIALKRFQSGEFGKLNKSVKFPETLNLAPYMRGTSDKSPIYQLYGAVIHLDVKNATFTGHYVCYIKNNQGKWFKADDSLVQVVELDKVLLNDAYMLFYARCSPRAPKLIRSLSIDPWKSKNPTISKFSFHLPDPWDIALSGRTSFRSTRSSNSEDEEYLTEHSSFFSETGSHTTESTNRESTSTDDTIFDHRDMVNYSWNSQTPSDSDTTSPSSSLSSPLRTRHSRLADLDRYSSDAEIDGDGFWARGVSSGKVMCRSNEEFNCRNNSNNNHSGRLAIDKSCDDVRGVYVRRSIIR